MLGSSGVAGSCVEEDDFDGFDWGEGCDEPIEASCDLENPESCESCQ